MPLNLTKVNRSYNIPQALDPIRFLINGSNYKTLLDWQKRARAALMDARLALLIAPPGSGKTTAQMGIAIERVIRSGCTHKVVIAAPKNMIGAGYVRSGDKFFLGLMIGGEEVDIRVDHNLTGKASRSKIAALKHFMLNDVPGTYHDVWKRHRLVSGCVCVTSHAALAQVVADMTLEELIKATNNATYMIDEAHHVAGVFCAINDEPPVVTGDRNEDKTQNRLGKFTHYLINHAPESARLLLASATPFRADRRAMLSPELRKKASTFVLPQTEHLKNVGIEKLDLNYVIYDKTPVDNILASIAREPNECHLICVPSVNHAWRKIPGEQARLIEGLNALYPAEGEVLTLMPEDSDRETQRERLLSETKSDRAAIKIRVVEYVQLVNEGVDWPACSRFHNANFGSSLPNESQKNGRLTRQFPNKQHVSSTAYLPNFSAEDDSDTGADVVRSLNNALLVAMNMDDQCYPIFLPDAAISVLRRANKKIETVNLVEGEPESEHEDLDDAVPVEPVTVEALFDGQMNEVNEELIRRIEPLIVKDNSTVLPVIADIVEKYGVAEELRELAIKALQIKVLRNLAADKPRLRFINPDLLEQIDFDRLVYTENLHMGSMFTCETDQKVLGEFRKCLNAGLAKIEEERQAVYKAKFVAGRSGKRERKNRTNKLKNRLTARISRGGSIGTEKRILEELYPKQRENERE